MEVEGEEEKSNFESFHVLNIRQHPLHTMLNSVQKGVLSRLFVLADYH